MKTREFSLDQTLLDANMQLSTSTSESQRYTDVTHTRIRTYCKQFEALPLVVYRRHQASFTRTSRLERETNIKLILLLEVS